MSFVNSLLKVFLGDKSGKDLKKLTPLVDEINNHFDKISSIALLAFFLSIPKTTNADNASFFKVLS